MSELRKWSTLTAAERATAIARAREVIASGETRWHVVARLCGIEGGIPLRTAIDEGWRARKRALDAERYQRERGEKPKSAITKTDSQQETARERGLRTATMMSNLARYTPAPITLPRVQFLEMS